MGVTAGALYLVGTGVSAYGKQQAGKYNKKIYDMNAAFSDQKALDAIARGNEQEQNLRQKVKRTAGSQRAALAAQGVELSSGSALQTVIDTYTVGEMDALTVRNNAAREAWGYRTEAANYRAQGKASQYEANNAVLSTILGGGADAARAFK